jgi:hypothetical protein
MDLSDDVTAIGEDGLIKLDDDMDSMGQIILTVGEAINLLAALPQLIKDAEGE